MSAVSDDAVEAACRAMHEFLGTGEADDLMLGPSDNSWDAPTWPRWKQWREAAEAAISAALASQEAEIAELRVALANALADKVSGCPFDYPNDLDETDPCPVCGGLGTIGSPNLCPFPPGAKPRAALRPAETGEPT